MNGTKLKPPFRWAGSKKQLAPTIAGIIRQSGIQPDWIYCEPFVGSGAVMLELRHEGMNWIYDANEAVYLIWKDITRSNMIDSVEICGPPYLEEYFEDEFFGKDLAANASLYYKIRKYWNEGARTPQAALILISSCFNGLWRVNSKGKMNTSYGKRLPRIDHKNIQNIRSWAKSRLQWRFSPLSGTGIELCDGGAFYQKFFYYLDPPYLGGHNQYIATPFGENEWANLDDWAMSESNAWLISTSDTPFIRSLQIANRRTVKEITTRRTIAANPAARGPKTELLISNFEYEL